MALLREIIRLVEAGYTKEEIKALEGGEVASANEGVSDGNDSTASAEPIVMPAEPKEAPVSETNPINQPVENENTKLLRSILTAVQNSNLVSAMMPEVHKETTQDVLANIIAPNRNK